MTTLVTECVKCAVCNQIHSFVVVASTNMMSAPDLDTRPSPMQRGTIEYWVQECPACGYTAPTIDDATNVSKEWLQEESYKNCEGHEFNSSLARKFYHYYMISMHDHEYEEAAFALLHCAWACDDEGDEEAAKTIRKKAADTFLLLKDDEDFEVMSVIRMDLLRRSGQFERMLEEYEKYHFSDITCRKIARAQKALARKHDDKCHTLNIAFNNRIIIEE